MALKEKKGAPAPPTAKAKAKALKERKAERSPRAQNRRCAHHPASHTEDAAAQKAAQIAWEERPQGQQADLCATIKIP